jgi:hypothetical protein
VIMFLVASIGVAAFVVAEVHEYRERSNSSTAE